MVLVLHTGYNLWLRHFHIPAGVCGSRVIPSDDIFHEEQGIDLAPQNMPPNPNTNKDEEIPSGNLT